jgi:hypothetical protein
MIPYSVTSLSAMPNLDVSMTVQVNTGLGRNRINRVAHSTSNFYPGNAHADSTVELVPATISDITGLPEPVPHVIELATPTKVLQIATLRKITAMITVNSVQQEIEITRLLVIDAPVTRIELSNLDTSHSAQVIVTYLT